LCGGRPLAIQRHPTRHAVEVNWRRCGPFTVSRTLYVTQRVPPELKLRLSAYTRQCHKENRQPEILDTSNLGSLAQRVPELSPAQRLDKLLGVLVKRSAYPGAPVNFIAEWDYPLINAENAQEAMFHTSALVTQ
jgi:hypothetical protein